MVDQCGPAEPDPASGRPSVVLPAGDPGAIAFSYAPPGLWMGVAIWLLAIGGLRLSRGEGCGRPFFRAGDLAGLKPRPTLISQRVKLLVPSC